MIMAGGIRIEELDRQIQENMGDIFFVGLARWDNDPKKLAAVFATASGAASYTALGLLDPYQFKFMPASVQTEVETARNKMIWRMEDIVAGKLDISTLPLESALSERAEAVYKERHPGPRVS
jgi:hypothetical protein